MSSRPADEGIRDQSVEVPADAVGGVSPPADVSGGATAPARGIFAEQEASHRALKDLESEIERLREGIVPFRKKYSSAKSSLTRAKNNNRQDQIPARRSAFEQAEAAFIPQKEVLEEKKLEHKDLLKRVKQIDKAAAYQRSKLDLTGIDQG